MSHPLLPDTKTAHLTWRNNQPATANMGLLYNMYVPTPGDDGWKRTALVDLSGYAARSDPKLHAALLERWERQAKELRADPITLQTDWRLVSGLGEFSSLEVGFHFDRYGIPVLRGSGIKGLMRAYILTIVSADLKEQDLNKLDDFLTLPEQIGEQRTFQEEFKDSYPDANDSIYKSVAIFRRIFGTMDQAGEVIFMDGFPMVMPKMEVDVLTPHFPEYYQGDRLPTDDQNPIPSYFLTVAPGQPYRFAVGARRATGSVAGTLVPARTFLEKALKDMGAGGKTSAGYGYFKDAEKSGR